MLQTLLRRLAPDWADCLVEETIPCPEGWGGAYALEACESRLVIQGDCALSRAVALRLYFEQACGYDILSVLRQVKPMEDEPPIPGKRKPVRLLLPEWRTEGKIPAAERGFFTPFSYTYAPCWWDAERWDAEVDMLALYGVNRPLLLLGSEYAWYKMLRDHGIGREYAMESMSGPSLWPRQLMGQLAGSYAPVDAVFLKSRGQLGKHVAERMRAWGMQPILPGFAPTISGKLNGLLKGARTVPLPDWQGFAPVRLLEPDCPAFAAMGESYHAHLESILGPAGGFWSDPLAERTLPELLERRLPALRESLEALYRVHTDAAEPVYMAQMPLTPPPAHTALRGDAAGAAAFVAVPGACIRCGAAEPESNPLLLTLQLEALTRQNPEDLMPRLRRYAKNRYGSEALLPALELLRESCYMDGTEQPPDSPFCRRPNTVPEPAAPGGCTGFPYESAPLFQAARLWFEERETIPERCRAAYRYDFCDILRQAMSCRAGEYYDRAMEGYRQRDARIFERSANDFLRLLENCDRLLGAEASLSLPARLAQARACAKMDAERNNFELAMLAQHSIYSGGGRRQRESHLLHGMEWREWSGLLGTLHYERWRWFFSLLAKHFSGKPISLETKRKPLGRSEYETNRPLRKLAELERQWLRGYLPKAGEEDMIEVAETILAENFRTKSTPQEGTK